jgi:hypothetical protein
MIGGACVKIPVMLGGLLELERLELGCQGLLVPAMAIEVGVGRSRTKWWSGSRNTPLASPLTRRPSEEGMRGLGRPSRWWTRQAARPSPHVNGARPRILVAGPEAASP